MPGKAQPFLHPTTAPCPSSAPAGAPGLPQCLGIAGIAQPGAAVTARWKAGTALGTFPGTSSRAAPSPAKADPQFAWHSPAVPRGSLAEMRRALVAVLGGKVPALEPRSSDVKELQPCSALP